jgi:hypothetical protein
LTASAYLFLVALIGVIGALILLNQLKEFV